MLLLFPEVLKFMLAYTIHVMVLVSVYR